MKRKLLYLLTAIAVLFALSVGILACTPGEEPPPADNADYSVTVKGPDGDLLSGITVTWSNAGTVYGTAVTGDDGKASASIPRATYKVELTGVPAGLDFPAPSVTAGMRNITLNLTRTQVEYTVAVVDKVGSPAKGVTVTWTAGSKAAGSAVTGDDGVAKKTLDYGEYIVSVANLPSGNVASGTLSVTGAEPNAHFGLINGESVRYTVRLRSEGGLKLAGYTLRVEKDNNPVHLPETDQNGDASFSLPAGRYTVKALGLPEGYTAEVATVDADNVSTQLTAKSAIINEIPAGLDRYYIGDIFHNYTFTTPYDVDGAPLSVSVAQAIKQKRILLINFWGTNCSFCVQEMPAMQNIYEKYGDKIEIVAVNNYISQGTTDSDSTIRKFYAEYGYTFPMLRDTYGFASKFALEAWPTTVIIDRFGAIARIESGALPDEGLWERLIEMYAADEYVQTFTPGAEGNESIRVEIAKPDVVLPEGHYDRVAETLNNTDLFPSGASVRWYGAPETEEYRYAWPFVLGTDPDVSPTDKVLYSSNTQKHTSYSVLFAEVTAPAGSVFTFDYYADTEGGSDILSLLWDGKLIKEIDGQSDGWKTCTLYADLTDEPHTLALTYMKDNSVHTGKDNVFIRNVRFTALDEIQESTDMLRAAAYGGAATGGNAYRYYADAALADDGYYHVNTSTLQNAALAGNDPSPILFINLLNATNWSGNSLQTYVLATDDEGESIIDTRFEVNGVTRDYATDLTAYFRMATYSDIPQYVPVDAKLFAILKPLMQRIKAASGDKNATVHDDEWLELCYFYSHYGDGTPQGDPVIGLTESTAIPLSVGENTANLRRIMQPFSSCLYTFTPETSAVYRIYSSNVPQQKPVQAWLYDENSSAENALVYCGDHYVTRDGVGEQNFELYRYLVAGKKYYIDIGLTSPDTLEFTVNVQNVGASAQVLTPAAYSDYVLVIDKNGNPILDANGDQIYDVNNPVEFVKDADGYYHAKNPDGTVGSFIYLDFIYANAAIGTLSIDAMLDRYLPDPNGSKPFSFKTFDFSHVVGYTYLQNEGYYTYRELDISAVDDVYKDYTARLKEISASAPKTGDTRGMVKVNDEIKQLLDLFTKLRVNSTYYQNEQLIFESVTDNEWLRYCWYFRQYDVNNI